MSNAISVPRGDQSDRDVKIHTATANNSAPRAKPPGFAMVHHGIASDTRLSRGARGLPAALLWFALEKNFTDVADWRLADYLNVSKSTVRRWLGEFVDLGYVKIEHTKPGVDNFTGRIIWLLWRTDASCIPKPPARWAAPGRTRDTTAPVLARETVDHPCASEGHSPVTDRGHSPVTDRGHSPVTDRGHSPVTDPQENKGEDKTLRPPPNPPKGPGGGEDEESFKSPDSGPDSPKTPGPGKDSAEAIELEKWAEQWGADRDGEPYAHWAREACALAPARWVRLLLENHVAGRSGVHRRPIVYLAKILARYLTQGFSDDDQSEHAVGGAPSATALSQEEFANALDERVAAGSLSKEQAVREADRFYRSFALTRPKAECLAAMAHRRRLQEARNEAEREAKAAGRAGTPGLVADAS